MLYYSRSWRYCESFVYVVGLVCDVWNKMLNNVHVYAQSLPCDDVNTADIGYWFISEINVATVQFNYNFTHAWHCTHDSTWFFACEIQKFLMWIINTSWKCKLTWDSKCHDASIITRHKICHLRNTWLWLHTKKSTRIIAQDT